MNGRVVDATFVVGSNTLYTVEMANLGGTLYAVAWHDGTRVFSEKWEDVFGDGVVLRSVQYVAEAALSPLFDRSPGTGTDENTPTDPCKFSAAMYREIGLAQQLQYAKFEEGEYCKAEVRGTHSAKANKGLGEFWTWSYP